jgi:hypothetical protein
MKDEILLGLIDRHIAKKKAEKELAEYITVNHMSLPESKKVIVIYRGYVWRVNFTPKKIDFEKLSSVEKLAVVKDGREITSIKITDEN